MTPEQRRQIVQQTFVTDVASFDELPSTNDWALEQARRTGGPRPLLVVARQQLAGRGRGANRWWSRDGALTFSLLLDAAACAADTVELPLLSLAIGVALCDTLLALHPRLDVGLKWPNDVYLSHKKVAGVLIECPGEPTGDVVVGIGLNVNNTMEEAPSEIARIATSLRDVTHARHDPHRLLLELLRRIEAQLLRLRADPRQIRQRWSDFCILTGRSVTVTAGDRQWAGVCQGLAENGGLRLDTAAGPATCLAGVVRVESP